MSNIAFLFLPLAFSSLPAVLPFVSPSSQVTLSSCGNVQPSTGVMLQDVSPYVVVL